jgi:hypothetical protein
LPNSEFEKLLLEAIDEGLSSLGDSAKQALYFHLERNFDLKKQEIPQKIEEFAEALQKILGAGASFLEILIMKNLYKKIGGSLDWQESEKFSFPQYVAAAKRSFQEKREVDTVEEFVGCEELEL